MFIKWKSQPKCRFWPFRLDFLPESPPPKLFPIIDNPQMIDAELGISPLKIWSHCSRENTWNVACFNLKSVIGWSKFVRPLPAAYTYSKSSKSSQVWVSFTGRICLLRPILNGSLSKAFSIEYARFFVNKWKSTTNKSR